MSTTQLNSVTRQAAKLHHGYTRQQLKNLVSSRPRVYDQLNAAAEARGRVIKDITWIREGDIFSKIGFSAYFGDKKLYRDWLELARQYPKPLPLP